MDDVQKLGELKDMTISRFIKDGDRLKDVADRLLATSFYFALTPDETPVVDGQWCVHGTIHCRFPSGPQIRAFGEALEGRLQRAHSRDNRKHQPYFVVQERYREGQAVQIRLQHDITDKMINEGMFTAIKLEIKVSDDHAETEILFCFGDRPEEAAYFPISGFPRCLRLEVKMALRPRLVQTEQFTFARVKWDSLEARKASWGTGVADLFESQDPLGAFGSAEYKNPGNAGDSLVQGLSERYSTVRQPSQRSNPSDRAELPAFNQDDELYNGENDAESPMSESEILRIQWLRLLLSPREVGNYISGPPDSSARQLYRERPSIFPVSVVDQLRTRQLRDWSNDPVYLSNGRSALNKLVRRTETLPGEPFELSTDSPQRIEHTAESVVSTPTAPQGPFFRGFPF
ncbi:uncharacterized protein Z520_07906 [Fonsecaea multimorphosa CBS 102226]|uniref:Uncharacterized protein n=1 Tax=Fonsecaea multimorphosa CBS 102226 TaxID=1442371 RepID=A0A0D2H464_9EURO|nr:uncharacterized protein Z520_07906 [Fonsecaea multimorphosa CBS 102226]KIX96640.1 hypothetical protein Z520_07906 [Fonsecaea multimorphosa CBS 102226]OAL17487.1 hypothetical protein AYO22_11619 [Fonsecaea multimorphosa]